MPIGCKVLSTREPFRGSLRQAPIGAVWACLPSSVATSCGSFIRMVPYGTLKSFLAVRRRLVQHAPSLWNPSESSGPCSARQWLRSWLQMLGTRVQAAEMGAMAGAAAKRADATWSSRRASGKKLLRRLLSTFGPTRARGETPGQPWLSCPALITVAEDVDEAPNQAVVDFWHRSAARSSFDLAVGYFWPRCSGHRPC
jgi:hypothetical protein